MDARNDEVMAEYTEFSRKVNSLTNPRSEMQRSDSGGGKKVMREPIKSSREGFRASFAGKLPGMFSAGRGRSDSEGTSRTGSFEFSDISPAGTPKSTPKSKSPLSSADKPVFDNPVIARGALIEEGLKMAVSVSQSGANYETKTMILNGLLRLGKELTIVDGKPDAGLLMLAENLNKTCNVKLREAKKVHDTHREVDAANDNAAGSNDRASGSNSSSEEMEKPVEGNLFYEPDEVKVVSQKELYALEIQRVGELPTRINGVAQAAAKGNANRQMIQSSIQDIKDSQASQDIKNIAITRLRTTITKHFKSDAGLLRMLADVERGKKIETKPAAAQDSTTSISLVLKEPVKSAPQNVAAVSRQRPAAPPRKPMDVPGASSQSEATVSQGPRNRDLPPAKPLPVPKAGPRQEPDLKTDGSDNRHGGMRKK